MPRSWVENFEAHLSSLYLPEDQGYSLKVVAAVLQVRGRRPKSTHTWNWATHT